jgi:hypothetical protein
VVLNAHQVKGSKTALPAESPTTNYKAKLDESETKRAGADAKNVRQHDSIVDLQGTVAAQRTGVRLDHLEPEDHRRLKREALAEANRQIIEETRPSTNDATADSGPNADAPESS